MKLREYQLRTIKFERWGVETKELKSFECYYFAESKENRIMKWDK
jgi:hypothetical protein